MFAKIKSSTFIDALQFELIALKGSLLRGVLKDDSGSVCSVMEKNVDAEREFIWQGLNDLPYGRYTLELFQGGDEMKMNLVKRV
ncbi:MAG: hypothetical protein EOO01_33870 [Chitinophagaceae bacterium]|nr:MAG: hypothetical protein EOO01_33870 [Chitinophagaceae bacterium]